MEKKKSNEMVIRVNDGLVRVPLMNNFGEEVGFFRFRPTDINIVKRYNECIEEFENLFKPLVDANIKADGTAEEDDEDSIRILFEAEEKLDDILNRIFDTNTAANMFEHMHPFAPVDGEFYCQNVFEGLGVFIQQRFGEETKKANEKIKKYTAKYSKKEAKK